MNPVMDCLMDHRSVRKYSDREIEPEVLDSILRAGTRAATGGNLQLYTMIVVDDETMLTRLDQAMEVPFLGPSNCRTAVLALVDLFRVRKWIETHTGNPITTNRPYNFFMAIWDALIALQNIVIAAESAGLGSCYLGSGVELDVGDLFGAPDGVFPAGLVSLGYPVTRPGLSMRLPDEAVIHRNRYRIPDGGEIADWYAERDRVWDTVPEARRELLAEQGIGSIAEALSIQKFSRQIVEQRSGGILRALKRSGFDLHTGLDPD
jgi:nitroreductase